MHSSVLGIYWIPLPSYTLLKEFIASPAVWFNYKMFLNCEWLVLFSKNFHKQFQIIDFWYPILWNRSGFTCHTCLRLKRCKIKICCWIRKLICLKKKMEKFSFLTSTKSFHFPWWLPILHIYVCKDLRSVFDSKEVWSIHWCVL